MPNLRDVMGAGKFPHHDYSKQPINGRAIIVGYRHDGWDEDFPRPASPADFNPLVYWRPSPNGPDHDKERRGLGSFSSAMPAQFAWKDGIRPVFDTKDLAADKRFDKLEPMAIEERFPISGTKPRDQNRKPSPTNAPDDGKFEGVIVSAIVPHEDAQGFVLSYMDEKHHNLGVYPAWDGLLTVDHHAQGYKSWGTSIKTKLGGHPHARSVKLAGFKHNSTEIDPCRVAGIHSLIRVEPFGTSTITGHDFKSYSGAALNLMRSGRYQERDRFGEDPTGYGACVAMGDGSAERGSGKGTTLGDEPDQPILSFLSHELGGLVHPGHINDVHTLEPAATCVAGKTPQHVKTPTHAPVQAIFYSDKDYDASLDFLVKEEPIDTTYMDGAAARVRLMYKSNTTHEWAGGKGPGRWKWHTRIPMQTVIVEKPPKLTPLDPKNPGGPGTPGGPRVPPGGPGPYQPERGVGLLVPSSPAGLRSGRTTDEDEEVPVEYLYSPDMLEPWANGEQIPHVNAFFPWVMPSITIRPVPAKPCPDRKTSRYQGVGTVNIEGWGLEHEGCVGGFVTQKNPTRRSRFPGVQEALVGGVSFMPVQLGIADYATDYRRPQIAVSETYVNALSNHVYFSVGKPSPEKGHISIGHRWKGNDNGEMFFEHYVAERPTPERETFSMLQYGSRFGRYDDAAATAAGLQEGEMIYNTEHLWIEMEITT